MTQLPGSAGCIQGSGNVEGCGEASGFEAPQAVAVSHDGKNVYVAGEDSLVVFSRDSSGVLTQLAGAAGCFNSAGSGGCGGVRGASANAFDDIAISGDDKNVYWATDESIVVFQRDPATGALTQPASTAGCVNADGSNSCLEARGATAFGAQWLTISPDGTWLYAGSSATNTLVSEFKRDPATGALSQLSGTGACVSHDGSDSNSGSCKTGSAVDATNGMAVSPDGSFAYVVSDYDQAIDVFKRTNSGLTETGAPSCVIDAEASGTIPACTTAIRGLQDPRQIAISPDGNNVYAVAGFNGAGVGGGAIVLSRSSSSGALTQPAGEAGCVTDGGSDGEALPGVCAQGHGLKDSVRAAVSADGENIYLAAENQSDIGVLSRNPPDGSLSQDSGADGCHGIVSNTANCTEDVGMGGLDAVAVSPDGMSVYGATAAGIVAFSRTPPPPPPPTTGPPTMALTGLSVVGENTIRATLEVDSHGLDTSISGGGVGELTACGPNERITAGIFGTTTTASGSTSGTQQVTLDLSTGVGVGGVVELHATNSAGSAPTIRVYVATPNPPQFFASSSVSSVTLNALDIPGPLSVNFTHRAAFNYGLSTTYGTEISVTEWQSPSECPALVSKTIKHLKPGTTYHWQLEDIFSSWYNEIYRCGELGLGECSQRTAANTHYHGPDQTVTTAVVSAPRTGTVSTEQIGLSGISCALKSGCQGSLSVSVPTRTCQRSPLGCDVPSSVSKLCTSAATCQVKGATASAAEQGLVLANGRFTVPAKKHARAVLRLTKAGRDFFKSGKFFKDRKKTSVLLAIAAGGPHKRRIKTTSPLSLRRGGPG